MDNSKNPLLLFGTRVIERSDTVFSDTQKKFFELQSDTVKVPFSDAQKKFFEFLSIVKLPIAFFGSWLVLLINYAIGPSTLKTWHELGVACFP